MHHYLWCDSDVAGAEMMQEVNPSRDGLLLDLYSAQLASLYRPHCKLTPETLLTIHPLILANCAWLDKPTRALLT
jgi:hypothetical protein